MTNVTKTTTYSQINKEQENVSPFVSSGPKSTETLKESNLNITKRNLAKVSNFCKFCFIVLNKKVECYYWIDCLNYNVQCFNKNILFEIRVE